MALEEIKNAAIVIGTRQVVKHLHKNQIKKVFIAADAEPHVREPVMELCRQGQIAVEMVESMEILGRAVGIEVGSAAVALLID